jgi:hypothetical protein
VWFTVNYLLATFLQTREGGGYKIERVEKLKPGRARFYFNITSEEAEKRQLQFHSSSCAEFEAIRKNTIDLCF